jgi:hypothetical protein
MSSLQVNFATTGDPNGKGLAAWPAFDSKTDLMMGLPDQVEVVPLPHQPALDFWEGYFENRRKSPANPLSRPVFGLKRAGENEMIYLQPNGR